MLNSRKIKALIGLGVILVPSMIFAETSLETSVEGIEKAALSSQVDEIVLGEVNIDGLNVRSYPDTEDSTIIKTLPLGQQVRVIYKTNNFYKVYINGEAGFIYSEYITIPEEIEIQENTLVGVRDLATGECKVKVQESETQEKVAEETKETVASSKGDTIISTAMQYLGTPYVYGGSSLTKGTDCSGFTQGVMKLNGITIPRTSKQQSQTGKLVSKNDMKPGDLLFFGSSKSSIFHTGIYIGNGQMIHASTAKSGGVIIANAFTGGGAPLQVIRRVH
ncbi:MAG: C40 family peptidase [Cellulosilyticum sp.]|nr:C40 family peptidase [Cellulosilyticum sp.]